MRVNLRILVPLLAQVIGRRELEVEFAGQTVSDVVEHLVAQYGQKARQALLDETGKLDAVIQVLLNETEWITHDQLDTLLRDGDNVTLMLMVAGG